MKRRSLSALRRAKLFRDKGGICHLCGGLVHVGKPWDLSRVIPLELGGADDESNFAVAHRNCHRVQTATQDVPAIAEAKRRESRHLGIKPAPVRPIRSQGFRPSQRRIERKAGGKLPMPPRRSIYGSTST